MKNLKKVLALVLVLAMILGTFTVMTASAEDEVIDEEIVDAAIEEEVVDTASEEVNFADVIGTPYQEAVFTLAPMGVIAGYDDDKDGISTFEPANIVTRAEMAAFIVRELGLTAGSNAATIFEDVPAGYWGSGSISIANSKNIIVGYGDGTFGPENQVTFEEAVKMLVCALGYEEDAKENGGWSAGYLAIGKKKDLLIGVEDMLADPGQGCDRGTVALMLYNALDIPIQEVQYYNGQLLSKKETGNTMLSEMGYKKFEDVTVKATDTSSADANTQIQKKGYVALDGVDKDTLANGFDFDAYLGQPITVYVSTDKKTDEYKVVAMVGESNKGDVVVLDIADIATSESASIYNDQKLHYYLDKASSTKTNYYKLAKLPTDPSVAKGEETLTIIYNSAPVPADSADYYDITYASNGTVTLIDAKKDGVYERAIIDTYRNAKVAEVNLDDDELVLEDANGGSAAVVLDDSHESNLPKFSIVDTKGNKLALSDLAEDDVCSIYSDIYDPWNRDYVEDAESLKIIVSNDTVEGAVTKTTAKKVYIDDVAYETDGFIRVDGNEDFDIDSEGTFFLDFNGDIAFVDTEAVLDNFEFVYDGLLSGREISLYAMNASGDKKTYKMASTVKVMVKNYTTGLTTTIGTYHMNVEEEREDLCDALNMNAKRTDLLDVYVMSAKTNSNNEISKVTILEGENSQGYVVKNSKMIGDYVVNANTVVFTLPEGKAFDEDDLKVVSYNSLSTNENYKFVAFDHNKDDVVTAMVLFTSSEKVDANSNIAVIQSVAKTKNKDDDVLSLTMIQEGKTVTKLTQDLDQFTVDSAVIAEYGDSAAYAYGAYPGQIIMYSTDSTGAIADTYRIWPRPMYDYDYEDYGYWMNDCFQTWDNNAQKEIGRCRLYIASGIVANRNNNNKNFTINAYNEPQDIYQDIKVGYEGARVVVVNTDLDDEEQVVKVGSSSDIKNGDYVVVRKYYGTTRDIVVYKGEFAPAPAYWD